GALDGLCRPARGGALRALYDPAAGEIRKLAQHRRDVRSPGCLEIEGGEAWPKCHIATKTGPIPTFRHLLAVLGATLNSPLRLVTGSQAAARAAQHGD